MMMMMMMRRNLDRRQELQEIEVRVSNVFWKQSTFYLEIDCSGGGVTTSLCQCVLLYAVELMMRHVCPACRMFFFKA